MFFETFYYHFLGFICEVHTFTLHTITTTLFAQYLIVLFKYIRTYLTTLWIMVLIAKGSNNYRYTI